MANWKHRELTTEELKEIVRGVYDGKYFTSLQCADEVITVFMPILFIGAEPSVPRTPKVVEDIRKNRKNKLNHFRDLEQYEKDLQEWKDNTDIRNEFIDNIGMVYEDISKAGPGSINGYPTFFSCKIVSREDTNKFIEMYNKYVKMRQEFEKEWEIL